MVSADLFCIYADFLLEFGYFEDAEQVYEFSYKTNCTDAIIINNYACFMLMIKQDFVKAEELFTRSFQYEAGHINIKNLILLYEHVFENAEKAQFYKTKLEELDNEGYYSSFESTQQNEV
jgi:Flp pilus assembly protein TadD